MKAARNRLRETHSVVVGLMRRDTEELQRTPCCCTLLFLEKEAPAAGHEGRTGGRKEMIEIGVDRALICGPEAKGGR